MNLPDAQNHPGFAYRPETGEEPFASMLAVPVRRSGRVLGVLAVQRLDIARRLEGLPLLLVVGTRPAAQANAPALVAELLADPVGVVIRGARQTLGGAVTVVGSVGCVAGKLLDGAGTVLDTTAGALSGDVEKLQHFLEEHA